MINDANAPLEVLESELDAHLRELVGDDLTHAPGRYWRWGDASRRSYAILIDDAGPASREPGEPPERALELIRLLTDLGYAGTLSVSTAREALLRMGAARHIRLARRAHPEGQTLALVAASTVFLEDLDTPELEAALRELDALAL